MTEQPSHQSHEAGNSRLKNFLRQEREDGLHPAIKALHARPNSRVEDHNRRAVEYARIARGRSV